MLTVLLFVTILVVVKDVYFPTNGQKVNRVVKLLQEKEGENVVSDIIQEQIDKLDDEENENAEEKDFVKIDSKPKVNVNFINLETERP